VVEEEEGTMVAVEAVMADAVDTVDVDADETITILARPIQQRKVCVTIWAPMFLTMVKILQQI
jgi:hypothetical protein